MARQSLSESERPRLDMSPLIDISFLLLIYFLVTSTLEPVESDLSLTMPGDRPIRAAFLPDPMEIEITRTGAILANSELLDLDTSARELPLLIDRLRTYAESARLTGTQPRVSISAHQTPRWPMQTRSTFSGSGMMTWLTRGSENQPRSAR